MSSYAVSIFMKWDTDKHNKSIGTNGASIHGIEAITLGWSANMVKRINEVKDKGLEHTRFGFITDEFPNSEWKRVAAQYLALRYGLKALDCKTVFSSWNTCAMTVVIKMEAKR